jgi:hypothetical protein
MTDPRAPGTFTPEVVEELARHGLSPRPGTRAELLREQINDLYRYEIRKLRDRCRAGEFSTRELPGHVIELRRRYILLSIPMSEWLESR